jgi:hypothetical protein
MEKSSNFFENALLDQSYMLSRFGIETHDNAYTPDTFLLTLDISLVTG